MGKKKTIRVAGFVGALCVSAALIATAANSTGAYFTDSKSGTLQANSGHLTLNVDPGTPTTLNFANLMPGADQAQSIHFGADVSSGTEDVWLYFPDDASYQAFTGASGPGQDGGLGRYGHFKVTSTQGNSFESYNLKNAPAGTDPAQSCVVDAIGNGGSAAQVHNATDTLPFCGVPHYIKVADGLASGQDSNVTITFGLTGRQTAQNQAEPNVNFQLVGTQHGVTPDQANF